MNKIIDELYTLLSVGLSTKFTSFYKGEVAIVPKSYLPALMIIPVSTNLIAKSTAKDKYVYKINIKAVDHLPKYFDEDGTATTLDAPRQITELMEARDSNGIPTSTSVLGLLRANIGGTNFLFNNDILIEYSITQQGEFPYIQADMSLDLVSDLLARPS